MFKTDLGELPAHVHVCQSEPAAATAATQNHLCISPLRRL
jgi:hypothetical protein